jgi:hypothetical protein
MLRTQSLRRISFIAGTILTVTSMMLTAEFGLQIGIGAAAALVAISFMAAYIPAIVWELKDSSKPIAYVGAVIGALIIVADVTTNASTLGVYRNTDVVAGNVQQIKFDDAREKVEEARRNLTMWTEQLQTLTTANAWAATTKADGLRAQLESAQKAIDLEEARGGCKQRCLALMRQKNDLETRIATIELREDLTKRIDATKALVDRYREQSAQTDVGGSAVGTQNLKLASIVTLTRKPGEAAQYWTDTWLMVLFGALITLAAAFFNLISITDSGLFRRLMGSENGSATTTPAAPLSPAQTPSNNVREIVYTDNGLAKLLAESPALQKFRELPA